MKKLLLLLVLLSAPSLGKAQWAELTDTLGSYSIFLLSPNDGWAVAPWRIRHWDGSDWTQEITEPQIYSCLYFSSHTNGWVFSYNYDSAYRYNGTNWNKEFVGGPSRYCDFVDSTFGWAANSDQTYKFQNGVWSLVPISLSGATITSIAACSINSGWLSATYSDDSTAMYKYDGSQWQLDTVLHGTIINEIDFTDPNHGWACGYVSSYKSSILRYNGSVWNLEYYSNSGYGFRTIHFYDYNSGWVNDWNGLIYHYYYGSWSLADSSLYCTTEFSFCSPTYGWLLERMTDCDPAFGANKIYYTSSAGLGVKELSTNASATLMKIFPNPAQEVVNVMLNESMKAKGPFTICLIDPLGRLVFQQETTATTSEFSIADLRPGLYIVSIRSTSLVTTQKLLIE